MDSATESEPLHAAASDEHGVFLSTLPAGRGERRRALTVVLVSGLVFLAAAPFAKTPLPVMWGFIPMYQSALVMNDLITAVLLFGQYGILRSRTLYVLASGYLFTAFLTFTHALTFPGLLSPAGLLGAGPQTTAWLYMFWHGGFPLFVIVYALTREERGETTPPRGRARMVVVASVGSILALAGGLTLLATVGHDALPAIMQGHHYTGSMKMVVSSVWGLSILALVILWRRRPHSVLDLWLMVVMCAWLFDIALAAVLNAGRFDFGFYAGRLYGLLAATFVLMRLLLENGVLYARLVASNERERRERQRAQRAEVGAAAANRAKSEFLANMSHELRTPLNGILGFAELMHDGQVGAVSDEHKEYLGDILTSARHLLQLINDVLDLAKVESGKMTFRPEPVDLARLVADVQSVLRTHAAQKHIEVKVEVDHGAATAVLDPAKLKQVLYNYLSNALKFTPVRGRVTIRIREENEEEFVLEVEDTGPGIRPEETGKLFMEFEQLESSTAKGHAGTGLGLALTKRLVEAQGGRVGVRSNPGQGSVFFAVLPWTAQPLGREPGVPSRGSGGGGRN